ncbi:hypothetical protein GQ53DRAFT_828630 [Thozetella sp. PMI_491]|nr:hypothetical protein GQ53DRAFT_828630 [Thozetella sp. PMI_491]
MKFTTSLIYLLTVAGAYALPGSSLEERQAGQITVTFFDATGCGGSAITDFTWVQPATLPQCINTLTPGNARSFRVIQNSATVPLRLYNQGDCNESSVHDDISGPAGGCHELGPFGSNGVRSIKWRP